ncbi:hypothetical protein EV702DRAFT_1041153 [Suillus placidus]|uniref:Uncharacterized protein n=1 Tax=Suillus placidus TaxID=48579 RepID=A0A9P7A4F7_9AGAM|nr:hypothetical protein EV702DRAFT_1041153 [Suillus placidus]
MTDVLIMNPPSPTSSATYIDYPSPGHKARAHHMSNKGKSNLFSSAPEDESTRVSSDANFLSQAQAILNDSDVPMDVIKEAIAAQFATCEKHHTHLMSKMWEVEEINRWKRFSKRTVATLEKEHRAATSGLQLWLELADKYISKDSNHAIQSYRKEQETFGSVQMDLDSLEGLGTTRGMADGEFIRGGLCEEDSDEDSDMTDNDLEGY